MKPQRGLGKGLNALISDVDVDNVRGVSVLEVDILLIDNDVNQPRKKFDAEKLKELSQSIAVHGIMQPLIVVENKDRYTIVAGERRFRAAKMAQLKTVPVLVKSLSKQDAKEFALIENIQREDLNAIEQSTALKELMEEFGFTQEEVAKRVGKSRSAIANLVRLQYLPEEIKTLIEQDKLSAGHARTLLALDSKEKMFKAASAITLRELSVRQTEKYIKGLITQKEQKSKEKKYIPKEILQAQEELSVALETKVSILGDFNKGKISIEYYNKEQLEQIYDFITKNAK